MCQVASSGWERFGSPIRYQRKERETVIESPTSSRERETTRTPSRHRPALSRLPRSTHATSPETTTAIVYDHYFYCNYHGQSRPLHDTFRALRQTQASDDNSQNLNSAQKTKRTCKEVSRTSLSVLSLKYHGTEYRIPQTETCAIPYRLLRSYHANTPSRRSQCQVSSDDTKAFLSPSHPHKNSARPPPRQVIVRASTSLPRGWCCRRGRAAYGDGGR